MQENAQPVSAASPQPAQVTSPEPAAVPQAQAIPAPPAFMTAWLLSGGLGIIGADRFYLGRVWTGVLKALTLGGFGLWAYVDVFLIAFGMVVVPFIVFVGISIMLTVLLPKMLDSLQGLQSSSFPSGITDQNGLLDSLGQ
jgi:TM2 domain-containing membrane protein YozV